jgi:hypothetical protein
VGQPQTGLGRPLGDTEQQGKFAVGAALQVGHLDGLSLFGWQSGYGLADDFH